MRDYDRPRYKPCPFIPQEWNYRNLLHNWEKRTEFLTTTNLHTTQITVTWWHVKIKAEDLTSDTNGILVSLSRSKRKSFWGNFQLIKDILLLKNWYQPSLNCSTK
jgi:hypothetical protein